MSTGWLLIAALRLCGLQALNHSKLLFFTYEIRTIKLSPPPWITGKISELASGTWPVSLWWKRCGEGHAVTSVFWVVTLSRWEKLERGTLQKGKWGGFFFNFGAWRDGGRVMLVAGKLRAESWLKAGNGGQGGRSRELGGQGRSSHVCL